MPVEVKGGHWFPETEVIVTTIFIRETIPGSSAQSSKYSGLLSHHSSPTNLIFIFFCINIYINSAKETLGDATGSLV